MHERTFAVDLQARAKENRTGGRFTMSLQEANTTCDAVIPSPSCEQVLACNSMTDDARTGMHADNAAVPEKQLHSNENEVTASAANSSDKCTCTIVRKNRPVIQEEGDGEEVEINKNSVSAFEAVETEANVEAPPTLASAPQDKHQGELKFSHNIIVKYV